jgi:uncharacterized protein YbjT (DUF2867 family)
MIVVFGATGNIGPQLVHTLVSRGLRVRAVVRDLPRAQTLLPSGAELVEAECRLIDLAAAAGARQYVKVSGIDSRPDGPSKIQRIHG